jgi:hypothetical protein
MSVPVIASADEGLLSPITNITKQTSEIVKKGPQTANSSILQKNISEKVVKPTTISVGDVVNSTTRSVKNVSNTVKQTADPIQTVSQTVDSTTQSIQSVEQTVKKTVENVVPNSVDQTRQVIDVNLSDKPSVKGDVVDQEVKVSLSLPSQQQNNEVKVPVVSDIVETEPIENVINDKSASTSASSMVNKQADETVVLNKSASVQEQVTIAEEIQKKRFDRNKSGEPTYKGVTNNDNELPLQEKKYPDYPAEKMITPSQSQGGGQSPSTSNNTASSSTSMSFLAVMDGKFSDSVLKTGNRYDGKIQHYYDQWLNAPPGEPPQSFFF